MTSKQFSLRYLLNEISRKDLKRYYSSVHSRSNTRSENSNAIIKTEVHDIIDTYEIQDRRVFDSEGIGKLPLLKKRQGNEN